ncbi:glycosyltransferase family A protein [Alicyclobacillus sp.]|uniref:glycosyltransferase family A protein n=1 Tax=Alicyclobacillus sp. TaxID=61169 RepID=UPI0025C4EEA7|nr:glycosyltransferase family A protein [Alicyclobacillus sp.]MCL6515677.1 glycosyltransferase family 2 protein [Alicyclobacillus sp.]
MHRVSAVIATKDRLGELAGCLSAIAAQRFDGALEVIVVNDGGARVDEVCRAFADRMEIRWINLDEPCGQVAARNRALSLATGDLAAFCDDDDRWLPEHVAALVDALDAHPEAVAAFTDAELVEVGPMDGRGRAGGEARESGDRGASTSGRRGPGPSFAPASAQPTAGRVTGERRVFAWRDPLSLLTRYNPIIPSSLMYRTRVHGVIGGLDEAMSHYWDWDFALRLAKAGTLLRVPRCLTLYAVHTGGENLSADPARMADARRALFAKHGLVDTGPSNFWRMCADPRLAPERAESERVWDGDPAIFHPPV